MPLRLAMGRHCTPTMFTSVVLLLLGVVSLNHHGANGLQIGLRQTFYDGPSSDDYAAVSNVDVGFERDRGRYFDAEDYEEAGERGYRTEDEGGNEKQRLYGVGAAEDDAYAGYQSPAAGAYEPRSSHRDRYEPVNQRKSKLSKGHSTGYNDEDDDDDRHGYQDKKRKKKVKPKVIIVKKIIPLSTTTAVG